MSEPVIRLEAVTKIYRRSHLGKTTESVGVDNVSIEVGKGEVFGLLGLNGSGKTTTIKMLMGLLYATKGEAEVFGKAMPDAAALARVGYLPEAAYLNRYLTGRETIRLFATLGGIPAAERERRVGEMVDKVGMNDWADKRIEEYSKGMVQRICIGQALVHDPDLLILDEPITGLDPLAINEIRNLILWLKDQGKTVFLSSHDISEVARVCDRIGILCAGKLARTADSSDYRDDPDRLEGIFEETVAGTQRVGALSFG
jgi:ABC-2 type transport system ATP-binding protein